MPKDLTQLPDLAGAPGDVLSDVLRRVRLTGSLQFCFMPHGAWRTDDKPSLAALGADASRTVPFHIVVAGDCWLRLEGREIALTAGDVVAFPTGAGHQLGAGCGDLLVTPVADLPPKPWRALPTLNYGATADPAVRLLCGYLQCDALNFLPLRRDLPNLLHVRTAESPRAAWLRATIDQIVAEVDRPQPGGLSVLERLTEITFIELLRHRIIAAGADTVGWLAALADPALGRCLAMIHMDPHRDWSLDSLAAESGLSRSTLTARFEAMLETSPVRYLRDWRLYLASVELHASDDSVAEIGYRAGYGTEAAFSRAFTRAFGAPPATWRRAKSGQVE